jgi:hypothetical protein
LVYASKYGCLSRFIKSTNFILITEIGKAIIHPVKEDKLI